MIDERVKKLASEVINYSINLQKGEKILIDVSDEATDFAYALMDEAYRAGGLVYLNIENMKLKRKLYMHASIQQIDDVCEFELSRMKKMDAYVTVRKQLNASELSDIPKDKLDLLTKYYGIVHLGERVKNTKWCIMAYPSDSFAQQSNMSTEAMEDFYFKVCSLDYGKMKEALTPLKNVLDKTKKVQIKAKNTDLIFTIAGEQSGICAGTANIPDGEVCMGVDQGSVNGVIAYNIPSNYQGFVFTDICLKFKDGKIVEATANDTQRLNRILDSDVGARFIGEFAIGVNPHINKYIINTLFDEKMAGSIHFTPGSGGKNTSAIHWDIVQSHTPEFGGGQIYFDDVLIRDDGLFVIDELVHLNPKNFDI